MRRAPAHGLGHREAVPADDLVQRLPVAARADAEHEQRSVAMNGICSATCRRITSSRTSRPAAMLVARTRIASVAEEGLGQREPAVGAVVEGALEPLARRGVGAVGLERDDEPREAGDALGAHRVPLVGHGAGADLLGLERLEQLALVLQQPQVAANLAADCAMPLSASSTCCRPSAGRSGR